MESQMKIDGNAVRAIREERSWSQEHLANAAGLSARTIQRIEADGVGSSETRLALAGAFGVSVSSLAPSSDIDLAALAGFYRGRIFGWVGWCTGAAGALAGITSGVLAGSVSMGQAGAALGVAGAGLGIFAALMGHLQYRVRARVAVG